MSLNSVSLSGNLTHDPELRATPGGTQVLTFGLAFNERRKNGQTGQWEDVPNFISCTIFGNRAEAMSRILTKGMHVALQGRLRWSSWEKNGEKRSKIELIVDEVDLMAPKQGQQQGGYRQQAPQGYAQQPPQQPQQYQQPPAQQPYQQQYQQPQMPQPQQPQMSVFDEDIPF